MSGNLYVCVCVCVFHVIVIVFKDSRPHSKTNNPLPDVEPVTLHCLDSSV